MGASSLNIDIQPIAPSDIPAIAALAREIWHSAYSGIISQGQIDYMLAQRYNHQQLREDLENREKWWHQAFVEGRRGGFACCEIHEGEFKLDKLYIHPERQRQGVGGALIAHVAAQAKTLGYPAVILSVNKRNEPAINAYRKLGFVTRAAVTNDIGGGYVMDDYIMTKAV
jgi:ribosomal protein S18 acetylase RimI-like enzyme